LIGTISSLMHRLADLAPRLQPELLHRVITVYGLEDCVDLVAEVTPQQLSHVFDLDLWHPPRAGLDEQFDAGRFGLWIEVLVEAGADVAAAKLAQMPIEQLIAGFAHHVRVFDVATLSPYDRAPGTDVGAYRVVARREDAWDALVTVLMALAQLHHQEFHRLMRALRSLSNSRPEIDGLHALLDVSSQMMLDVATERERRREKHGFASPADARAFLQMSRTVRRGAPQSNPIARSYFREMELAPVSDQAGPAANDMAEVIELLADAGVLAQQAPRGLLNAAPDEPPRHLPRLHAQMHSVFERDPVAYGERNAELAYLANMLIAGCSIQSRPFAAKEAADAAVAVCNLGFEKSPHLQDDYLVAHDLIGIFQIGWTALYKDVVIHAAHALIDALSHVRSADDEVQSALNMLRIQMKKQVKARTPWRAEPALDVIAILDKPAWAALVALIAECPVMHAAIAAHGSGALTIDASAFEFISDTTQIASIGAFLDELPAMLA
jgi:hypothetical protein